jgi:hypothetical protein
MTLFVDSIKENIMEVTQNCTVFEAQKSRHFCLSVSLIVVACVTRSCGTSISVLAAT